MMERQLKELKKLGLSEKEARLYLVSLEVGPSTISKLAQKSGVKRSTIYEFLGEMLDTGLLEITIFGKRKLYSAIEPKKLQKLIERQKDILEKLTPELSLMMAGPAQKPRIKFYEGRDGILKAYYEILDVKEGSEILGYATPEGIYAKFSPTDIAHYIKKRASRKIKQKLIMPSDDYLNNHIEDNKKELRETILIPRKNFSITNEINICENKVIIFSLVEEMVAVIIESKQIADTQRAVFNLLWNTLQKNK